MTLLAGLSIFAAAFLLFALEPLVAKRILPWFGGSSAVWSVCLVFYQVALLAGYAYARVLTRYLKQRQQAAIHILLLLASLTLLPIGPTAKWKPDAHSQPMWLILGMLTATIGLPFAVLSATSPLLQDWLARSGDQKPYRFFALSNVASLSALLAYPLVVEPFLDARQQSLWWSVGFATFVVLCSVFSWMKRETPVAVVKQGAQPVRFYWFALAACGSMLLLSITNQIDENVAAVPLLWVLPLAVYLISFIVAFGARGFYRRELWLRVLAFGLAMLAYAAYDITALLPLQITVPVFLGGLFIGCVFCNSELYRLRPPSGELTSFYLAIAAGGAVGAVFVGLIAPQIFGGIYELPLTMTLTAGLALALTWQSGGWGARVLWAGVTASMAVVLGLGLIAYNQNALALTRSFYGSLRVVQSRDPGPDQFRSLYHGTVQHGTQLLWPSRRLQATTYYGPNSGVGILLREWQGPKRVAVVGLGAGTLATYGQSGDTFRFYEINPQVVALTHTYFTFLQDSQAHIEVVDGDARLSLEREQVPPFDVIVLDAFSGDAIPVHLLTKEAMAIYTQRLKPGGVIAFHVSNNFLDLVPVVRQLADNAGYKSTAIKTESETENQVAAAEWVLVSKAGKATHVEDKPRVRLWTDDFNSLLPILKTPDVR